jgi:hypothetical protein
VRWEIEAPASLRLDFRESCLYQFPIPLAPLIIQHLRLGTGQLVEDA